MAVKSFATNYLVADHDIYKEFMNNRFEYMKKNNLETDILFCNANKKDGNGKSASFLPNGKTTIDDQNSYAAICKWHCITISYSIWCNLVRQYVKEDSRVALYKKFVNVPVDVLKKFKYRVEKSIENAKCDYNKRLNGGHGGSLNGCRYLAMFWTYLDLKRDCKTQRYFPDLETIQRAAKVFGYADKENPFEMNGRYTKRAERNKSEEKPMEQNIASVGTSYKVSGRVLLTDIIEDRRLTNPLIRAGIKTVGEFRSKTEKELLKIRTFGVVKLRLVKEAIANAVPKDNEKTEESVIDIAEQAAKEVEEERKGPDTKILNELTVKLGKAEDIINTLSERNRKAACTIEELRNALSEKNQRIAQLENAIEGSKNRIDDILEENAKLKSREMELNLVANPKNLDTFALLNTVLEKMKDSKMEYILLTIDGMTIDIHPKQNFTVRTREAGYGRV